MAVVVEAQEAVELQEAADKGRTRARTTMAGSCHFMAIRPRPRTRVHLWMMAAALRFMVYRLRQTPAMTVAALRFTVHRRRSRNRDG